LLLHSVCAQAKPTMRAVTGFGILPGMESENAKSRRLRRRFSAEEKARIIGLYEESGLTRWEFCRREGSFDHFETIRLGKDGHPAAASPRGGARECLACSRANCICAFGGRKQPGRSQAHNSARRRLAISGWVSGPSLPPQLEAVRDDISDAQRLASLPA
jgi:hypothetical protein